MGQTWSILQGRYESGSVVKIRRHGSVVPAASLGETDVFHAGAKMFHETLDGVRLIELEPGRVFRHPVTGERLEIIRA